MYCTVYEYEYKKSQYTLYTIYTGTVWIIINNYAHNVKKHFFKKFIINNNVYW